MNIIKRYYFQILIILLTFELNAQPEIKFLHFSIEEGLSQVTCNTIIQDNRGFIWVGTQDGLNRFNGYNFKVFRHDPKIKTSISDNYIWCLIEDQDNNIWIGTRGGGLNVFDSKTNTFKHFKNQEGDDTSLSNNFVRSLFIDSNNNLWVGTEEGLNLYNPKLNNFKRFLKPSNAQPKKDELDNSNTAHHITGDIIYSIIDDKKGNLYLGTDNGLNIINIKSGKISIHQNVKSNKYSLSHNNVKSLLLDKSGKIWVGTDGGGLNLYNQQAKKFIRFLRDENNSNSLSNNSVYSLLNDSKGNLWVGTLDGLNLFLPRSNSFKHYKNQENNPSSLSNNFVYSLLEDFKGNLWVGTYIRGLNLYDHKVGTFEHYKKQENNPNSLNNNNIRAILKDRKGNLWVGTQSGGINLLDSKTGKFTHYIFDESNPNSLSNNFIRSLLEEKSGKILIGTHGGGLNVFNPESKTFKRYRKNSLIKGSISEDIIFSMLQDSKGNIWIGNYGGGLDLFNIEKGTFKNYRISDEAPLNFILSIKEDKKGNIWIGTMGGLVLFKPNQETYKIYKNDPNDSKSISHNSVNQISIDHNDILWIASYGGGINRFDPDTEHFSHYRQSDGIVPTDGCSCVFADKNGYKWISTINGFLRYNPSTKEIYKYDEHHGLQGKGFNVASCYIDKTGKLYFGGINGFNSFHPDSIHQSEFKPNLLLTDFKLFNKKVLLKNENPNDNNPLYLLEKDITHTKRIVLPHNAYVMSFEYASLDIGVSDHNSYMYKLEGFDQNWNYVGQKREATYTNLPYGDYVFCVKGTNSDGKWSDKEIKLQIKITPPPYLTIWAKISYAILISSIILLFIRSQKLKVKRKEFELQKERKALEEEKAISEKLEELNREKDGMINIVAHDLKSPLNKLSGFLQLIPMVGSLNNEQIDFTKKMDEIILQGSKLIKNLLDINSIEHNKLNTEIININLIKFIPSWISSYQQDALRKRQKLHLELPSDKLQISTDKELLSRVLDNLLTNAIKFTKQDKNIYFKAYQEKEKILFSVKDEGPGISKEDQKKMFIKFQKLTAQPTGGESSSGLGLSIIKMLIEKLNGEIEVNSIEGIGTEFIVKFTNNINNTKKH